MIRGFLWLVVAATAAGCGEDPCEELAAVCERCPPDGDGPVARASCLDTVEKGSEDDCQARLDDRSYEPSGCR